MSEASNSTTSNENEREDSGNLWNLPLEQIRYYLTPMERDGTCDPGWPLAHLWPIYVGNFECPERSQLGAHIRQYFAFKGLFVRWWFNLNDGYHNQYQLRAGVYDALVYFVSERDARLAISLCNTKLRNAYRLNVFPGRDPIYFPAWRTVLFQNLPVDFGERDIVQHFKRTCGKVLGRVNRVVKYDTQHAAVEFLTARSKFLAISRETRWDPMEVHKEFQKQRYVERDITQTILDHLATNPRALDIDWSDPLLCLLRNDGEQAVSMTADS